MTKQKFGYEFKDIPPGKYQLTAEGRVKSASNSTVFFNLIHKDPVKFEVKPTQEGVLKVDIQLQRK